MRVPFIGFYVRSDTDRFPRPFLRSSRPASSQPKDQTFGLARQHRVQPHRINIGKPAFRGSLFPHAIFDAFVRCERANVLVARDLVLAESSFETAILAALVSTDAWTPEREHRCDHRHDLNGIGPRQVHGTSISRASNRSGFVMNATLKHAFLAQRVARNAANRSSRYSGLGRSTFRRGTWMR